MADVPDPHTFTYLVRVEYVGGPADGQVFKLDSSNFEPGEITVFKRDGHLYVSNSQWAGERRVQVHHKGRVPKRKE